MTRIGRTVAGTLSAFTLAAGLLATAGAADAATPRTVTPAQVNCNPVPAPPDGFRYSGACYVGPQLSEASASCARSGEEGITNHDWATWRCEGELRGDNLYYYFLYVQ